MKKCSAILKQLLAPGIAFLFLTAVISAPVCAVAGEGGGKKTVVATIHPVAAILHEITGDRFEVVQLLSPGSSPHTFEPRPSDLRQLEHAAALFYVGPDLDKEWVGRLPAAKKIEMLHLVPPEFLLPAPAGQQHESLHAGGIQSAQKEIDPHFWTDPLTVKAMIDNLVTTLINIDSAGREEYLANARKFKTELDQLHSHAMQLSSTIKGKPIILFHPSFNYFIKRYGLFLAGLIEPVPGKEPTPRFLKETLDTIEELRVKALFSEVQLADKSAKVLAEAAGIGLYKLDPIGGVPGRQSYRDLILYNLQTLVDALQ